MPDFQRILSNPKHVGAIAIAAAILIVGATLVWLKARRSEPAPAPTATSGSPVSPDPADGPAPSPVPPETPLTAATVHAAGAPAPPPEPPKTTARITFTTSPAAIATVSWGKTRLGVIGPGAPLVITRPRDSGPLDVIVKTANYLPVQTRAHTFADSRIVVKLTPPDQKQTLIGYRAPLDAGIPLDGATPEATSTDTLFP